MNLRMINGDLIEIPMFDPVVSSYWDTNKIYADNLLTETDVYQPLFDGKKDIVFLDLGANVGTVTLYAWPVCKRIVAVEPSPATFTVLKAVTHKFDRIELFDAALAPYDGQHEFYLNDINPTASSTVNTYGGKIMVRCFTLESILRIHQLEHVDVLKCDIEGAEGESLTLEQLIKARPIVDTWYIETHSCPKSVWEEKLGRLVCDLMKVGYNRITVDRRGMSLLAQ